MSENSEVPTPVIDSVDKSIATEPQPSRRQRLMGQIKSFLQGKPKTEVSKKDNVAKNQFKRLDGPALDYEAAQKKLFEERLAESRGDFKEMLTELTGNIKPEVAQMYQDKLQQNDPVLLKALSLFLMDKYNFNTDKRNNEIKRHNRELTNQAMRKGLEPGEDHIPKVDLVAKSEKVALFKNLQMSLDNQMRQQNGGKKDLRADAAFANKDISLALLPEPQFEQTKPQEPALEPFILPEMNERGTGVVEKKSEKLDRGT